MTRLQPHRSSALGSPWLLAVALALASFVAAGCGDSDAGPDSTDAALGIDAGVDAAADIDGSCSLSGGCDFVVGAASECPDPVNDPGFCSGICGGFECCWCEGAEPRVLYLDCFDCFDAGPEPDAS